MILIAMVYWRRAAIFWKDACTAIVFITTAGLVLIGYQLTGYVGA